MCARKFILIGKRLLAAILLGIVLLIVVNFSLRFAPTGALSFLGNEVSLAQGGDPPPIVFPPDGAVGVPVSIVISATFLGNVTYDQFTIKFNQDAGGVLGVRSPQGLPTAIFTPSEALLYDTTYTVRLLDIVMDGNPYSGQDCDNNQVFQDYCWTFTTFRPAVSFEVLNYEVVENVGQVDLIVALNGALVGDLVVTYLAVDGSANYPSDYLPAGGTIVFTAGELIQTERITIVNDDLVEPDEFFQVILTDTGVANPGAAEAMVTIINDDTFPIVSFSPTSYNVIEGEGQVNLAIVLDKPGAVTATVNYLAQDVSATFPADYSPANGTVTFAPGELSRTVSIGIVDDILAEGDETFQVVLTTPVSANLGLSKTATVTIEDNDPFPIVSFSPTSYSVTEGEGQVNLAVVLDKPGAVTATVNYLAQDVSATFPADYSPANGTVTFVPGELSRTVSIDIVDDSEIEDPEIFQVVLTNTRNVELGNSGTATVTIFNDDDTPPAVVSMSPVDGASDVSVNRTTVSVTFSEAVTASQMSVEYNDGLNEIPGVWDGNNTPTLTFTRDGSPFPANTVFTVTVLDVVDLNGNPLAQQDCDNSGDTDDVCWSFTTFVPEVSFDPSSYSVAEGEDQAALTVTLSGVSEEAVSVSFETLDGTATASSDYVGSNGTLAFAPGTTSQSVPIGLVDDGIVEETEDFQVVLTNLQNVSPGAATTAQVNIQDDDVALVSFEQPGYLVTEEATQVTLTVRLDQPSFDVVTVQYETVAGTATDPVDYVGGNGLLTFGPGATSQPLQLNIVDDNEIEAAENFQVVLTSAQNADLGNPAIATVTIADDDAMLEAMLSPSSATVLVGETIDFVASHNGGASPFKYTWNFGDGPDIISTELTQSHAYANPGLYNVVFGVTDAFSNTATANSTVLVGHLPQASFLVNETIVVTGDEVIFTNTSTGTEPLTYLWNFGDGHTSTEESPTHVFADPGDYTVILEVSNQFGTSAASILIEVKPSIVALAEYTVTKSVVVWPEELTGTARFEASGRLQLPASYNHAFLRGPVTFTLEIGGQSDRDIITLRGRRNKAFFHESYEESVSGLEIRDVVIFWFPGGKAFYLLAGQFSLPPADLHTNPPRVAYSFSAPVITNGVSYHLVDSTEMLHEVQGNMWLFEE